MKYTLYGCIAIVLWSSLLGLMRLVTEALGPVGGSALIYTLSSLMLLFIVGLPKLSSFSLRYLILGTAMFASYEILLALALGFADTRLQAMEVMIINYLWPALTVVFAIIINKQRSHWILYPSIVLAFVGVVRTISGDQSLSLDSVVANVSGNPVVYLMALAGALIWAGYCALTQKQSSDDNAITLFFMATAAALWVKYGLSDEPEMVFSVSSVGYLVVSSLLMAGGYGLWNIAIARGNMLFLAVLSYFTPVLSTLFSSVILGVSLGMGFWQGVAMVTCGSLLSWWATSRAAQKTDTSQPQDSLTSDV